MNPGPAEQQDAAWTTEGVAPMWRPGLVMRLFMRMVAAVERLNRRQARLGNPCVYSASAFPWAAPLEREWPAIRGELDQLLLRKQELPNVQDITADARSITHDDRWKVFLFTAYGVHSRRNCELCPQTWRAVRRIPGLRTAMFSILEAGKCIPPHRGPYNGVLRLHLALKVPQPSGALGIRVGSELCQWEEGRALIFDDSYEHEVWNRSQDERVVLFVDFDKPLAQPARLVNALMIRLAAFTPFLREGQDNLRRWEQRFHSAARPAGGES